MKNSGSEDLESCFPFRPECRDDMPKTTRFKPRSGKTLSRRKWEQRSMKWSIGYGRCSSKNPARGVHPSIKGEVWEFLLCCFDPKITSAERKELMQRRRKRRAIDIVRNSTVTTVHTIQAEKGCIWRRLSRFSDGGTSMSHNRLKSSIAGESLGAVQEVVLLLGSAIMLPCGDSNSLIDA